jgi:hypothetical protein
MAITENTFTADEAKAAIGANPELAKVFSSLALEVEPIKKEIEPKIIGPVTERHATTTEQAVKELTGIEKQPNEKYYDYMRRAMGEVNKTKAQIETELATLKSKSNPSEQDKAQIELLRTQLKDKDKDLAEKLSAKDKQLNELTINSDLNEGLRGIAFKKDLPESLVKLAVNEAKRKLIASAKIQEDGKITYVDKDGNVIQNQTEYRPKTSGELLLEELKDIIDPGRQQDGAGSKEPAAGQKKDEKGRVVITALPATVKSQVGLTEFILKAGYTDGSKEFSELWAKFAPGLPLRDPQ